MILQNKIKNILYDTTNSKIEELFYKIVFPNTFSYLNSMQKLYYFEIQKKDYIKIKKASEELHKMFVNATKYVLNKPDLYKKFNFNAKEWRIIKDNYNRTKDKFFYGRMDIGFNLNFTKMKIFEYNTGLCGDVYDTTTFQQKVFEHYALKNPQCPQYIKNSLSSGYNLLYSFGQRWKWLISSANNKTVYFICTKGKEEQLVLNSIFISLKQMGIKYKVCLYGRGLKMNSKKEIYDIEENKKVDIIYKTYAWYIIFKELAKEKHLEMFDFFNSKKCSIIEPSWKTIMGNKALLPYVNYLYPNHPLLLQSSFDPFDKCFLKDKYVIEKGLQGRGSMMTKKVERDKIKEKKPNVIYQKMFNENFVKKDFFIMGTWIVGEKFGGMLIKKSKKMINEYNCNVIPVRILL